MPTAESLAERTFERRSRQSEAERRTEEMDAKIHLNGMLPALIDRQKADRDTELRKAADVLKGTSTTRSLTPAQAKEYRTHLDKAADAERMSWWLDEVEAEKRSILKVKEAPIYGEPGSPHSFVLDQVHAAELRSDNHNEAVERLARYANGVAFDARSGSAEGRRAIRAVRNQHRDSTGGGDAEVRALLSGGGITSTSPGGMAAFVLPAPLLDQTGAYNEYVPSMAMQATEVPTPEYGLSFSVPCWSSPPSVAVQTEGTAVSSTTPSAELITSPLATLAAGVPISQLLADRAGAAGAEFDAFCFAQVQREYWSELDLYVIESAIANAGSVPFPTWSVPNFWGALGQAQAGVRTTAGTRLPATHLFVSDEFYSWASTQVDSSNRPVWVPTPAGAYVQTKPGPNGAAAPGDMRERVLGSNVFLDGNIPTVAGTPTQTQVIVANAAEIFLTKTDPVLTINNEPLAASLEVELVFKSYVGCLVRHPAAVQVINGAGLVSTPTFAG